MRSNHQQIASLLEKAYADFHAEPYRNLDPVHVVHEYSRPQDREVVAFATALLAYGSVSTIVKSVRRILFPLGNHPYEFLRNANLAHLWDGFCHRFTRGEDVEILFSWLQSVLKQHRSLEEFFLLHQQPAKDPMKSMLSSFVKRLKAQPLPLRLKRILSLRERNLKYLVSDPEQGSACKRLNLFLRWTVRPPDKIDLGLWKHLRPESLILPLDTHLLKTLQLLQWTSATHASWQVAESATQKLKLYCPEDPVKYDFALCHLSMHGFSILNFLKENRLHA